MFGRKIKKNIKDIENDIDRIRNNITGLNDLIWKRLNHLEGLIEENKELKEKYDELKKNMDNINYISGI